MALKADPNTQMLIPLGALMARSVCADAVTCSVFPAAASPAQMYRIDPEVKPAPQMSLGVVWEAIATSNL